MARPVRFRPASAQAELRAVILSNGKAVTDDADRLSIDMPNRDAAVFLAAAFNVWLRPAERRRPR